MYRSYFQFNRQPFTSTPFTENYFPAAAIEQSLNNARHCIERGAGPVVIVGDVGTGKSLLLEKLDEQYFETFRVVHLACARLDERQELLQNILFELDLPYRSMSEGELRLSLMDYLKPRQDCPHGMLLIIDEAQNLPPELLDEIRLITNFVRGGEPRVRLVMAGTRSLEDRLNDTRLASFNQRIAARCYLKSFSAAETAAYITTHIDRVGGTGTQVFPKTTLKEIHQLTDGCPRHINQLCDQALAICSTRGESFVSAELAGFAWAEVQNLPTPIVVAKPSVSGATSCDDRYTSESDCSVIEFGELDDEAICHEMNASESLRVAGSQDDSDSDSDFKVPQVFSPNQTYEPREFQDFRENSPCRPVENKTKFPEPFAEEFEYEEEVVDQYLPLVAEQNRNSLSVSSEDLASLEFMADRGSESFRVDKACDVISDAESNFLECNELPHSESVSCETDIDGFPENIDYLPLESLQDSMNFGGEHSDDRDLIVVSRTDRATERKKPTEPPIPFPATAVSTGQAKRMDYADLFEQLRDV